MKVAFDIFCRKDQAPLWIEAVPDLDTARQRASEIAVQSPGEYFIYSPQTASIIEVINPADFEPADGLTKIV